MPRPRVLIVEDDHPTRLALRTVFFRRGWQVATAATVNEGIAGLDPAPDCIVLDLELPDGGGEAILRKVRADHVPTRMVAVATGVSDPNRLAVVRDLHPDLLLCKPLDADVLLRVCELEFDGANAQEEPPACPTESSVVARKTPFHPRGHEPIPSGAAHNSPGEGSDPAYPPPGPR